MHSVVIGPGLGRDDRLLKVVRVCVKFLSCIHFMLFITFSCFSENFASSAVYCNRIHRQGNRRFFCNLCKASSSLHTVCLYQLGLVSDGFLMAVASLYSFAVFECGQHTLWPIFPELIHLSIVFRF